MKNIIKTKIKHSFKINQKHIEFLNVLQLSNEKLNVYTVKFLDPYPLIAVGYSDGQFLIWGIKEYIYMAATGRRYEQIRQPQNPAHI